VMSVAGGEKRGDLALFVRQGSSWREIERVRDVFIQRDGTVDIDLAPWGRRGYAMLFNDQRSRLVVETHASIGSRGVRHRLPLKLGEGFIEPLGGGSLGVLYGGRSLPGRERNLEFATLRRHRLRSRVLIDNLQCDVGAIGIGRVGKQIRLAYGYGCDVGWRLNTLGGKVAYDPFRAQNHTYMSYPNGFSSAGGQIAFAHRNVENNRLSIRVIGSER